MNRRERRHRETRDEIVREARKLVARHGAGRLSMSEVAKRTDFTPPALYRYFPGGREEILQVLATSSLELLGSHFARVPTDLPPGERLLELAMAYLEFAREHTAELDIMLDSVAAMETLDLHEPGTGLLDATGLFTTVQEAIRDAAAAGVLRASSPDELMLIWHGAWSLLHGMAVLERLHQHHEALFHAHARDLVRAYLRGFTSDWADTGATGVVVRDAGKDAAG